MKSKNQIPSGKDNVFSGFDMDWTHLKLFFKKQVSSLPAVKETSAAQYGLILARVTTKSFFLMLFTAVTMLLLLYAGKLMWFMYTSTPVGQKFLEFYPERAIVVIDIVSDNLVLLSGELAVSAVLTGMAIGAVLQLSGLYRLLYLSGGTFRRILFIAAPLCAAIAWELQNSHGYHDYKTAYVLSVIPTLCVYAKCLDYASELVPEITDVFAGVKEMIHAFPERLIQLCSFLDKKLSNSKKK